METEQTTGQASGEDALSAPQAPQAPPGPQEAITEPAKLP